MSKILSCEDLAAPSKQARDIAAERLRVFKSLFADVPVEDVAVFTLQNKLVPARFSGVLEEIMQYPNEITRRNELRRALLQYFQCLPEKIPCNFGLRAAQLIGLPQSWEQIRIDNLGVLNDEAAIFDTSFEPSFTLVIEMLKNSQLAKDMFMDEMNAYRQHKKLRKSAACLHTSQSALLSQEFRDAPRLEPMMVKHLRMTGVLPAFFACDDRDSSVFGAFKLLLALWVAPQRRIEVQDLKLLNLYLSEAPSEPASEAIIQCVRQQLLKPEQLDQTRIRLLTPAFLQSLLDQTIPDVHGLFHLPHEKLRVKWNVEALCRLNLHREGFPAVPPVDEKTSGAKPVSEDQRSTGMRDAQLRQQKDTASNASSAPRSPLEEKELYYPTYELALAMLAYDSSRNEGARDQAYRVLQRYVQMQKGTRTRSRPQKPQGQPAERYKTVLKENLPEFAFQITGTTQMKLKMLCYSILCHAGVQQQTMLIRLKNALQMRRLFPEQLQSRFFNAVEENQTAVAVHVNGLFLNEWLEDREVCSEVKFKFNGCEFSGTYRLMLLYCLEDVQQEAKAEVERILKGEQQGESQSIGASLRKVIVELDE